GAFGITALIIKNEHAKTKISRMVTGSFLNLVGDVAYTTPEDLSRKLRTCIENSLIKIRAFKGTVEPNISEQIGARLRLLRQDAGMSIQDVADRVGASPRLLQAIEERPLSYHNAGLHLIARLLAA